MSPMEWLGNCWHQSWISTCSVPVIVVAAGLQPGEPAGDHAAPSVPAATATRSFPTAAPLPPTARRTCRARRRTGWPGSSGRSASPSSPRSHWLCTFVDRSAKTVGVVSARLSKTLIRPPFSATKMRPSGDEANGRRVCQSLQTVVSANPSGGVAARPPPVAASPNASMASRTVARRRLTSPKVPPLVRPLALPSSLAAGRTGCQREIVRSVRESGRMKTVILAGGRGRRLAEETAVVPKPMVEVGGRPIVWHIMKHYAHLRLRRLRGRARLPGRRHQALHPRLPRAAQRPDGRPRARAASRLDGRTVATTGR